MSTAKTYAKIYMQKEPTSCFSLSLGLIKSFLETLAWHSEGLTNNSRLNRFAFLILQKESR